MFKKLLLTGAVLTASMSVAAYAGNLYLGPALFLQDNTTENSNYRGLHPRLSVGYAERFDELYLAGEVFGVPASATIQDNHPNGNVSARSTRSIGASIIPGAMITEQVMGFARLGVVNSKFTGPNVNGTGVQVGLGLQTSLTPYWDMRAEYIYSTYRTVSSLGSVKSDQVGIGLVYKVLG